MNETCPPTTGTIPSCTVVVPSYRRPDQLQACLEGVRDQRRPADHVIAVRRDTDLETAELLKSWLGLVDEVVVVEPGMLAAMRAGAAAAVDEVIAFTDDDAVPRPDWLATLLPHFADPTVGAVGGRDIAHPPTRDADRSSDQVGRFTAWGRHLGNHHVGVGPVVAVDVLKGVNMAFRREALALPVDMHGSGAQVHNEILVSQWARARGWRLLYDPKALVDHFHGERFDADRRNRPSASAVRDEAHNLVVALLAGRPELFVRRAVYGLLIGDRSSPGLGRAALALVRREDGVARRTLPSLRGQVAGLRAVRAGRLPRMEPAPVQGGAG